MNWLGIRIVKYEQDLMALQEIMYRVKPNIVIETGSRFGGSSLFYANMMDIMNINGVVYTIDITDQEYKAPSHPKVVRMLGSSLASNILDQLMINVGYMPDAKVLVNLDSDHTAEFVIEEMEAYQSFVTRGSYLVVEDTNQSGPRLANFAFLAKHPEFIPDKNIEPSVTTNPNGYLLRT